MSLIVNPELMLSVKNNYKSSINKENIRGDNTSLWRKPTAQSKKSEKVLQCRKHDLTFEYYILHNSNHF